MCLSSRPFCLASGGGFELRVASGSGQRMLWIHRFAWVFLLRVAAVLASLTAFYTGSTLCFLPLHARPSTFLRRARITPPMLRPDGVECCDFR